MSVLFPCCKRRGCERMAVAKEMVNSAWDESKGKPLSQRLEIYKKYEVKDDPSNA